MAFAQRARGGRRGIAGDGPERGSRGERVGGAGGCKTRGYYLLVHKQDQGRKNDQNLQAGLFLSDPLPQRRRAPARRRGGRGMLAAHRRGDKQTLLTYGTGDDAQGRDSPWRGELAAAGPDIAAGKKWLEFRFEDAASFASCLRNGRISHEK